MVGDRTGKECIFDAALLFDALASVDQLLQDQDLRFGYFLLILSPNEFEAKTGHRREEGGEWWRVGGEWYSGQGKGMRSSRRDRLSHQTGHGGRDGGREGGREGNRCREGGMAPVVVIKDRDGRRTSV